MTKLLALIILLLLAFWAGAHYQSLGAFWDAIPFRVSFNLK